MISVALPNRFLLAVSSASTIAGSTTWAQFHWDNTRRQGGVGGAASCLADYPTLGVDEDALYIGVNQFCGASVNLLEFDSTSVYVLNKAALVGGSLSVAQFDGVLPSATSDGVYTPQGVDNVDANTNQGYVIGVDNRQFGSLVMHRITSPAAAPSISGAISVSVPDTGFPIDVPHEGGVVALDGLDDRLLQAVIRQGTLWAAQQIEVGATGEATVGGGRNAVRWYELGGLASTPAMVQAGTVFDPAPVNPVSYWMGAIMANGQGHAALGMSKAGATTRVNTAFTGRLAGDPPGAMDSPVQYSANTSFAYNVQSFPAPSQRWGDYSYTSVDPDDDMTFWTLQQYVDGTNSYAVRLVRLLSPPPAAIATVSPSVIDPGVRRRRGQRHWQRQRRSRLLRSGPRVRPPVGRIGQRRRRGRDERHGEQPDVADADPQHDRRQPGRSLAHHHQPRRAGRVGLPRRSRSARPLPAPPAFSGVPGDRTLFDAGDGATTGALAFTVADPQGTPVTLTASSSNPIVIPANRVQLGGSGASRTVTVTSVGQYGSSTITLTASDGVPGAPGVLSSSHLRRHREPVVGAGPAAESRRGRHQKPRHLHLAGAAHGGDRAGQQLSSRSGLRPRPDHRRHPRGQRADLHRVRRPRRRLLRAPAGPDGRRCQCAFERDSVRHRPGGAAAGAAGTAGHGAGHRGVASVDARIRRGRSSPATRYARAAVQVSPTWVWRRCRLRRGRSRPSRLLATYYVRIVALNAAGESVASNEAVVVAQPGTCTIPAVPMGVVASALPGRLTLRWDAPQSGAIPTVYVVHAGSASGMSDRFIVGLPGDITSASGLVPRVPYFIRMFAANACGTSGPSDARPPVCVQPVAARSA